MLSQFYEEEYALDLIGDRGEGVGYLLKERVGDGPLSELSPRERDVLGAMAEGKSNQGIAEALFVSHATVEKHVTSIFQKLRLDPGPTEHRRVLAVLAYMQGKGGRGVPRP